MGKQVLKKAILMAGILLSALVLGACETLKGVFQEPRLSINQVYLTGISFTDMQMVCAVNVENPNPFTIPFPEIDWELFVNANSFIKGVIKNSNSLKSQSTTVVDIPFSITFEELINTVRSLRNSNSADYRIALAAKFNLPVLGEKVFPLEYTNVFPVLRLPVLSFKGISVKNLSLTRLDFELVWEVENANSFAVKINDFSYNFAVNDSRWVTGKVDGKPTLAPGAKTPVVTGFSISNLTMLRDITAIITKGTDINYACGGNAGLAGDLPGLKDISLPLNFTGTTKLK